MSKGTASERFISNSYLSAKTVVANGHDREHDNEGEVEHLVIEQGRGRAAVFFEYEPVGLVDESQNIMLSMPYESF